MFVMRTFMEDILGYGDCSHESLSKCCPDISNFMACGNENSGDQIQLQVLPLRTGAVFVSNVRVISGNIIVDINYTKNYRLISVPF